MKIYLFVFVLLISIKSSAQDTTLVQLVSDSILVNNKTEIVKATFKGTNVINSQTNEQAGAGVLQMMIMHRFGRLNDGAYNFFGLDNATLRLGLTYGITSKFQVTIGRSSFEKAFDASLKYKVLQQTKQHKMPVSFSYFAQIVYPTIKYLDKPYLTSSFRPIYTNQLIIARKFTEALSLLVAPTYIHYNIVEKASDKNDVIAIGFGGRYKLTRRMSLNAEYDLLPDGQLHTPGLANSFSMGIDMETGGHVFQLVFTNSQGMTEPYFMSKTTGTWGKGDLYFGFNISRVFNLKMH